MNSDAVPARWRRFDDALATLRERLDSDDPHSVPDAVASALDALNNLTEALRKISGRKKPSAMEALAKGDPRGRAALALVYARGGMAHALDDHGALLGFGEAPFGAGPFGGGWMWQPYIDPDPMWAASVRSQWFAECVEYQPVLDPFTEAAEWLAEQRELARG